MNMNIHGTYVLQAHMYVLHTYKLTHTYYIGGESKSFIFTAAAYVSRLCLSFEWAKKGEDKEKGGILKRKVLKGEKK